MKKSLATVMIAATLTAVPMTTGGPASATPCDQGTHKNVYKRDVLIAARYNGEDSVYNNSPTTAQYSVSYGREDTIGVEKHWETGAKAGFSFAGVGADVEAKYGKSYTTAASTSASKTITQSVKPHHTAWVRALFYRRVLRWTAYTWRWSAEKAACVKHDLAVAYWGDPKVQYVLVQKEGHVLPGRAAMR